MGDCIFCKIVAKNASAAIVYEDDLVLALKPLNEASKGHLLIIPKKHYEDILDSDETMLSHFGIILKRLSNKIIQDNNATGLNILNANGKDAQQSVFHLHFHLIPRYPNDGLDLWIKQRL
jgi:histidine triad (HIT) family protein